MSRQALHRHLQLLEGAGLIERLADGRAQRLQLVTAPLEGVTDWVDHIRTGWEANADRLGLLLETRPSPTDGDRRVTGADRGAQRRG